MKVVATRLAVKGYKGRSIGDASFALSSGQCLVISGNSGSGKSLLHGLICGLVAADSGEILFDGMDMGQMDDRQDRLFRKKLGVAFQEPALISNLSISENLHLPLLQHYPELDDQQHYEMVELACQQFELGDYLESRADQLSNGIRSLVSLTRALITRPQLLIWDAPMTGIDSRWGPKISEILQQMKTDNKTIILFSNDDRLIEPVADLHLCLSDGDLKDSDGLHQWSDNRDV